MQLLCHRGAWTDRSEQNSMASFVRAFRQGHGVETDIRDCNGSLVIAHDMPMLDQALRLDEMLECYVESGKQGMLALNVKADGLHEPLREMLARYDVRQYFVFDMSVPDTLGYLRQDMPVAVRISEYEDGRWLLDRVDTVWLDAFNGEWYGRERVVSLLESGKRICVVSPELHRRPCLPLWGELKEVPSYLAKELYLCTDLVSEALEVFRDVIRD